MRKPKLKSRPRSKKSEKSGLLKEKSSMKTKSKIKLTEQLREKLRPSNSRESTKINHFGCVISKKSRRRNTNNSTRTSSKILAIL